MIPIIFFVTVLNVESVAQAINTFRPTIVNNYVNCISDIIKFNFGKPGYLVFANANDSNPLVEKIRCDILKKIHETNNYAVQIIDPDDKPICSEEQNFTGNFVQRDTFNAMPVAEYFVIIVDNYKAFTYLARKIIRSRFWNPYAKFVIFLIRFTEHEFGIHKQIENMLSCLFYYNVINIIVGVPKPRNVRNAIIYSWRPYDPPKFCGNFNESAKDRLSVENICENGIMKYDRELFENKLPMDMKGCILQILALERQPFISKINSDPNIEKILINAIFKRFNFSVKYETINGFRGERNQKGIWNGALKELVLKRGHVLLGGIFPDFDVHEDFEYSATYLADSYTWVVPRAYPSPPWISLSITFHKYVWYSAIAGFVTCVCSWKFLGQLSGDSNYNKKFDHCFINTWICLLGFSAYIRPKTQCLRIFFVFLNLYCIIFLIAYQTKLIDVLQNPSYENQVDTVQELVLSDLKFGGFEELHDLFYNSSDPFDSLVGQQWIDKSNMSEALREVAIHRNFSVLCSHLELAHLTAILPELNDGFDDTNYFDFPTPTFSVPLEMIALRGFPFMKKISRSVNLYKQLGVNAGIRRLFADLNMRKRAKLLLSIQSKDKNFKAISIQHLRGGFFALAMGIVFGVIIFLLEIISDTKFFKSNILPLIK